MLVLRLAAIFGVAALAAPEKRGFSFSIPASKGNVDLSAPQTVTGTFDGGMKTYGRSGMKCTGQTEGGQSDTVFVVQSGGTLQNVIIGANQKEGVYCTGPCTIKNVWWAAVCEDALSIKGDGDATVIGGGATGAEDKVIQHNGFGTVTIDGFTVQNFGKLYRSCGNCVNNGKTRKVIIKNVMASNGKDLAGINSNYGDTATFSGTNCATGVKTICAEFKGTSNNDEEPSQTSSGSSKSCIYSSVPAC